jgi:hypothetical protein
LLKTVVRVVTQGGASEVCRDKWSYGAFTPDQAPEPGSSGAGPAPLEFRREALAGALRPARARWERCRTCAAR